jgi:hypothetical protein
LRKVKQKIVVTLDFTKLFFRRLPVGFLAANRYLCGQMRRIGSYVALAMLAALAVGFAPHHHHLSAICLGHAESHDTADHRGEADGRHDRCVAASYYLSSHSGGTKCRLHACCNHGHQPVAAIVESQTVVPQPFESAAPGLIAPPRPVASTPVAALRSPRAPPAIS